MGRTVEELWRFRALVWALVCRHLSARYRGSFLGFIWSFLNPLFLLAVYAFVFQYYIRFDTVDNYTLFLFCGLLPWIWFSSGLLEATSAISSGGSLITKAMFPPQILPLVSVLTSLANFLFAIPVLLVFMLLCGVLPTPALLVLPVVILIELIFLLGLSFMMSALNVYFRDVQHILGNIITFWFFLCPILYPTTTIPERFQFTLLLNPVALFTQMYQHIFLNGTVPSVELFMLTTSVSLLTLIIGNAVFNHYREGFAELV